MLAQADEHHFHEARFNISDEVGVRLDAADDEDVVSAEGVLVEVDRKALGGLADNDGFHAGADRAAAVAFGNTVAFDQLALAFGGAATVAAHGGNDEGFSAKRLKVPDGRFNDEGDVCDAAAAGSDRNGLPSFDFLAEVQAREFGGDGGGDLVSRECRRLKGLADAEEEGVLGHESVEDRDSGGILIINDSVAAGWLILP